jgi:hypothetical protein
MDEQQRVQNIFVKLSMEHLREFIVGSIVECTPQRTEIPCMDLCEEEVCRKAYKAATAANIALNDLKAMHPIIVEIVKDVIGDYCESSPEYDDEGGSYGRWYNDE